MATYSQATINAMNARGKALLDQKKVKPPIPTPAGATGTILGRSGSRAQDYITPTFTPPTVAQTTSTPSVSTGRVQKQNTPTIMEQSSPTWLGDGISQTENSGGISNTSTTDTTANDYYADLLANQEEAARIRTQAALEANNAYIPEINAYNDKRLQDAYISKELNRVNLPQQLSSLGYSGGATETSMLGAMTDYENRRGTIEQDRNDAVGKIRQNAAQIEATGNADLADMSAQYYQNMITKAQRDEATAKGDYTDTIGAYSNDYQAEIDRLKAAGVPLDDYRIKALLAARNEKLSNMASSQADSAQQAFENYIRNAQLNYNISKPYFKPTSGGALSYSEALKMYNAGSREQAVLDALGLL
jgi:hypothetical protein